MDQWLQYIINTVLAVLGIVAGRYWERHDRRLKKDKEQVEKILNLVPVDSEALQFLRQHDFGTPYRNGQTEPFWKLSKLLSLPSYFFLNKNLEKAKKELQKELMNFQNSIAENIFLSDRHNGFWELVEPNETIATKALRKRSHGEAISDDEIAQVWDNYNKTKGELNSMANNMCKKYDTRISIAYRIL